MRRILLTLSLLVLATSALKMSWKDIQKIAGHSWGNNFQMNSGSWTSSSGSWNASSGSSQYSLVQHSSSINGKGAYDLLGIYLKQLIVLLSNTDNEIRVVRLEVDCTGENYKVLIRIMDCHGNKTYIGMLVHVCGAEIKVIKFFQSPEPADIIGALCFLDATLYNYPDGNIGNSCSNSILSIIGEFCSIYNGGNGNGNGFSWGASGASSVSLGGLQPLNGGGHWGGNGNGGGANGQGIKLHIKIPGSQNPTGKAILLGSSKP